ncbi:MAG: hypothetical protein O3A51_09290 [Verrucomicrobia bacterium]|nr:hypothetical protein [Verrucomicrobiota bacterium]
MSKAVFFCSRFGSTAKDWNPLIRLLAERLTPDNIRPDYHLFDGNNAWLGIFNPHPSLHVDGTSVCLGNMLSPASNWGQPGTNIPDGTYGLIRCSAEAVELVTDAVASRTIWYVKTHDCFMASSSQRAIIFLLGSFERQDAVLPWMLSSGSLGPEFSWDSRIRCLPGDARLLLDRKTWTIDQTRREVEYTPENVSPATHEANINDALDDVFGNLGNLDLTRWLLPLSGGVDSRLNLLKLRGRPNLRCITWGDESSLADPCSDAAVAKRVAASIGVPHEFLPYDDGNVTADDFLNRFLVAGEGRVNNIQAYTDGLAMWKHLHESGSPGIIRGDEVLGNLRVYNPHDVPNQQGFPMLTSFDNLGSIRGPLKALGQRWPDSIAIRDGERLESWRDRINSEAELPVILAALNDLKLPYVEIVNPPLSRRIVYVSRRLPEKQRNDKALLIRLTNALGPDIPYATHSANPPIGDIVRRPGVVNWIRDTLTDSSLTSPVPDDIVAFALRHLDVTPTERVKQSGHWRTVARKVVPLKLRSLVKRTVVHRQLDLSLFAFRIAIFCRMTHMLQDDAAAGRAAQATTGSA